MPQAVLCSHGKVRQEHKIHRERRRENDCSHKQYLKGPPSRTEHIFSHFLCSARRRDWSLLQEVAFDHGLEARSLLPAVFSCHFALFSHAFLEEAGMYLKLRVLWSSLEASWAQGTRTEKEARVLSGRAQHWPHVVCSEHTESWYSEKSHTWLSGGGKHGAAQVRQGCGALG